MTEALDVELDALHAEIRVQARLVDALIMHDQEKDASCWYNLFLWCEAKDSLTI